MQAVVIGKPSERRGVGALEGYRGGGAADRCALCDWRRPDPGDVAIVAALTARVMVDAAGQASSYGGGHLRPAPPAADRRSVVL
jgi:hypothetical protein